jgi:hypothetical protein
VTEPIRVDLRAQITWGDVESLPVLAASHFLVQAAVVDPANPGDIVLTVGYLQPPVLLGTEEQQRTAAAALDHVTVRPVARFSIPRARAAELATLVQTMLHATQAGGQQS